MAKALTSTRLPKGHPDYDPEMDSPEALARWRTRGIRNPAERAQAFHKMWAELEAEDHAGLKARVNDGPMRESEIEAAIERDYQASLKKRRTTEKG